MVLSVEKLIHPPIGLVFSESREGRLPSMTICPYEYENISKWMPKGELNSTFEDLNNLPSLGQYVNVTLQRSGLILPMKDFIFVRADQPLKCGTIEVDESVDPDSFIMMYVSKSLPFFLFIEFHDLHANLVQHEMGSSQFWIAPLPNSYLK